MKDEIIKFTDIDVIEYLNKTHTTADKFLLKHQIHNLNKFKNEINEELYKAFIANSDVLLNILNNYQHSREILNELNIPKIEQQSSEININFERCKELEKHFLRFEDEMEAFLTRSRYLVIADYFNENKYFMVITNDLTFIGEKAEGKRKYALKNSFSNKLVDVSIFNGILNFTVQNIVYRFTGKLSDLQNIVDIYEEVNYSHNYENESDEAKFDEDYMRYLIITEQFYELSEYLKDFGKVDLNLENITIRSYDQLKLLVGVSRNPELIVSKYAIFRFKEGLELIDKIQELKNLISDIFIYLRCFVRSLGKIYEKLHLAKISFAMTIEQFIEIIFDSLEKRIFNKFNRVKITEENLNFIKGQLAFDDFNFTYMMKLLLSKREGFTKKCLELAKKQISGLLIKYFE